MAMTGTAASIKLENVGKTYRLYQRPVHKFLDLFGLCPPGNYTEHQALTDINLAIGASEKVAIIGRNGAGKSTLLKIIAGLVQPTTGRVEVHGQISNLLQIGTGFHPDFTGRQNVFASLAHQGIIGAKARALFDEILDFAEIEEYIDQPMKTYSTGMCSRLMFSSSVVMTPDILIVDEILGVGDAYFAHKSFKRMRDLCGSEGTTLLLVTHDLTSAMSLCDRFIWIDRGRIWFEGDAKETISRYENSVKEQEEQALRQRNAAVVRRRISDTTTPTPETAAATVEAPEAAPVSVSAESTLVHVVIRSRTGFALPEPLALTRLVLSGAGGASIPLEVATGDPRWQLMPESNLGEPRTIEGRPSRPFMPSGSIYHKAEWAVSLPPTFDLESLQVECHYRGDDPADVRVMLTDRSVLVRGAIGGAEEWQHLSFPRTSVAHDPSDVTKQIDYGTAALRITGIEFLDHGGTNQTQVRFGEPLTVRVHCVVATRLPERAVTFAVGFARQGFAHQAYIFDHHLDVPDEGRFVIESRLPEVRLGSGLWHVHVAIGQPDIFRREDAPYFSVDGAWHHLSTIRLQFRVLSVDRFDSGGCFYQLPAEISVTPETGASRPSGAEDVVPQP